MARIKIEDLPVLEELSPKKTKGIFGGADTYDTLTTSSEEQIEQHYNPKEISIDRSVPWN